MPDDNHTTERGWRMAGVASVPGTGNCPPWHGLRRPRNVGVKRALGVAKGKGVPPDDWEDISRCCERSWKSHREMQYRHG